MAQSTNDSVEAFKKFVQQHPEIAQGIKKEGKSWKEVFEEWVIFGEDHEIWNDYGIKRGGKGKKKSSQNEMLGKILSYIKGADVEVIGKQLTQINGALSTIQELLGQFGPSNGSNGSANEMNSPYNGNQTGMPQSQPFFQPQQQFQPQQPPQQPMNPSQQQFPFRRD